jgi:hypothetical protein
MGDGSILSYLTTQLPLAVAPVLVALHKIRKKNTVVPKQVYTDEKFPDVTNDRNIVCVGVSDKGATRLPNLPDILATTGPELMEELDRWFDCLLQEHFKRPNSEHNYIYALKASAGRNHPIHTLMEAVLEDPEFEGRKAEEHAVWESRKATREFQALRSKEGMMKYLELACDQYYPPFEIPEELMTMIATLSMKSNNPT